MIRSYFSILSAVIRPEIQERIAVGILLVDDFNVYFNFSKGKLNVLKELIPPNNYSYVKERLSNIHHSINRSIHSNKTFFGVKEEIKKPYTTNYLEYLNNYSNNILNFTSPKIIDILASDELFNSLFAKYIDDTLPAEPIGQDRFEGLKINFYPKVEKYFNLEKEVSEHEIENLVLPIKVDLIGKNERPVFAQAIDLERNFYHIKNDLGIVSLLNEFLHNPKAFIITDEPNKEKFPKQHDIWYNLKTWEHAEIVDISEVDKVEKYAVQHGVSPLV